MMMAQKNLRHLFEATRQVSDNPRHWLGEQTSGEALAGLAGEIGFKGS